MSTVALKDRQFWEKIADRYAKQPISDEEAYQKKLQITQAFLSKEMKVLEFGCGTGSTAIQHAPFVDHILATDLAQSMLDIGKQRAEAAGVNNISFECASIEDLDAEPASFDVVLGLNILHLCRNPRAIMEKVNTLLKPGGYFIQSTVCLKDIMPIGRFAIPVMQMLGKAPYVNAMSCEALYADLDAAGFHIVEQYYPEGRSAVFIVASKALE